MTEAVDIIAVVLLLTLTLSISIFDWKTMIMPDEANALVAASGLLFSLLLPNPGWVDAVLGGVTGGVFAGMLRLYYFKYRGIQGLGLGDVKFIAAAGCWTGIAGLMPMLILASFTALSYCGLRLISGAKITRATRLPFGPFLCVGLAVVVGIQIFTRQTIVEYLETMVP
ncbi:prepilin peptidase [Rhizobium laguerreae]|uniref:prepilin peptidase n=1 Tax=Rhizobium laguerreae TaxID=1076926 RepID=UPI001C8FDB7E|nr:A24 family peptidase [Rhizobium laguerreae]MBY3328772.1 prepilin peptidase [Rhizobium laguerreae]